tara:strand:- start:152 stop:400 length:249 start_codon:yes stop_codon:yes gene_type:complete
MQPKNTYIPLSALEIDKIKTKEADMKNPGFEINQEVTVDSKDCGYITFIDNDEWEGYYVVESKLTGTVYFIQDEERLGTTNI